MNDAFFDGKTTIIADGIIRDALTLIFDKTAFKAQKITSDARLFVFANTLDSPDGRRSSQTGLKKLQQLLAQKLSTTQPIPVSILSFTPNLKKYNYLLENGCNLVLLPFGQQYSTDFSQTPSSEQWRALIRLAAEEELEIDCSTYRHGLNSLMAAARIYLGAAIVGHVTNSGDWEMVLSKLENLAQNQMPELKFQRDRLTKALKEHKRFAPEYKKIKKPAEVSVQILDDNFEIHGWKTVLEAIFPERIKGFTSWSQLKTEILTPGIKPPHVLLLDCNLGKGDAVPTGLELLHSIRSQWQEVRVIFLTAFDDAALALNSLREGANLFFAKALNAAFDRRSLDYYQHFAELLTFKNEERKICELWRQFRQKLDEKGSVKGNTPDYAPEYGLEQLLRLGFFIIFSEVDNLWWTKKPGGLSGDYCFRAMINLIQIGYPKLEELARQEKHPVRNILRGGAHASKKIPLNDFESTVNYLFSKLNSPNPPASPSIAAWARPKPSYWAYTTRALQSDSTHPGLPEGQTTLSHDVKDSLGAVELLRGVRCINNCKHSANSVDDILNAHRWNKKKRNYSDVMFIDDKGHSSEWFKVIDTIFPNCRVFQNTDDAFDVLSPANQINLLILDLRQPSYSDGINALERILLHDPSIPVLTVSAGSDSFPAITSLRHGAIDFISKTLPFSRDKISCFEFADEFINKCELLLGFGKSSCRRFWRELQRLRAGIIWENQNDLKNVISKLQKCSAHKKSLGRNTQSEVPPDVRIWSSLIADEVNLILHLRRQVFWMEEKRIVPKNPKRFNYDKTYQIRPIDFWRWEHILQLSETSDLIKLIAVSCGILVERLARWNWCLVNKRALNPSTWGASYNGKPYGENINEQVSYLNAQDVWNLRNEALRKKPQTNLWDQSNCDIMLEKTFASIKIFLNIYGASF